MKKGKELGVVSREDDLSRWYTETVLKADLADYGPVRGTMVIKPHGFGIWERIQRALDKRFRETGHRNAYFPLLIPKSFLEKEAEHVEGFAPEVAWVERAGNDPLEEALAIRPTSEAMICHMYAKWIHSYRDLPVLINQWANVMRWEKTTRPFLRTTEFLWQEGHTVHATEKEAREETAQMLEIYREVIEGVLAVPLVWGMKSDSEKFAGAVETHTVETLLPDGQALQMGTSHFLGTNFAHAFGIHFQDKDGKRKHPFQTSWGVSTRLIGGLVLTHGDDRGLVLPPHVSPIQVVIVTIPGKKKEEVMAAAQQVAHALNEAGMLVHVDDRDHLTPGFKYNDWELKGIPLRLEIGPRDLERGEGILARRDTGEKRSLPLESAVPVVQDLLDTIQENLLESARKRMNAHIRTGKSERDVGQAIQDGMGIWVPWNPEDSALEGEIKENTRATIRCFRSCVECESLGGEKTTTEALFARAW